MICEIHLTMEDGSEQVIGSDGNWLCKPSPVVKSAIYYGEDFDARAYDPDWAMPGSTDGWERRRSPSRMTWAELHDRYSPAVRATSPSNPTLIRTPKDEYVLDFGQNMAGWVEFDLPALEPGSTVKLSYSEVMQDGCFYRDNLRTAEAQYTYISDGKPAHARPHGTFYGFRYVKVEGDCPRPGGVHRPGDLLRPHRDGAYRDEQPPSQPPFPKRDVGPEVQLRRRPHRLPPAGRADGLDRRRPDLRRHRLL